VGGGGAGGSERSHRAFGVASTKVRSDTGIERSAVVLALVVGVAAISWTPILVTLVAFVVIPAAAVVAVRWRTPSKGVLLAAIAGYLVWMFPTLVDGGVGTLIFAQVCVFLIAAAAWPGRRWDGTHGVHDGRVVAGIGLRVLALVTIPAVTTVYFSICLAPGGFLGQHNTCRRTIDIWPVFYSACVVALILLIVGFSLKRKATEPDRTPAAHIQSE
jgi:hypothetical protein